MFSSESRLTHLPNQRHNHQNRLQLHWLNELVLAVAVGGGGSTKKKKHATTQSTGEPLPALQAGGYRRTQRLNQLDPPKQFPLDRMRLSLRDLLVIGPPLLAKKERQVQAINQKNLSFPFLSLWQNNWMMRCGCRASKILKKLFIIRPYWRKDLRHDGSRVVDLISRAGG